jgi:hypothetical protein
MMGSTAQTVTYSDSAIMRSAPFISSAPGNHDSDHLIQGAKCIEITHHDLAAKADRRPDILSRIGHAPGGGQPQRL